MLGGAPDSAGETPAERAYQVILCAPLYRFSNVNVNFLRPPQDAGSHLGGADADDRTQEQNPGINRTAQDQFKEVRGAVGG